VIAVVEDGTHQQDVREVRRASFHHVWVVEGDDVTVLEILHRVWGVFENGIHRASELAYDHATLAVRYEGELVCLLADHGAYGGGDEHPVHLMADVL